MISRFRRNSAQSSRQPLTSDGPEHERYYDLLDGFSRLLRYGEVSDENLRIVLQRYVSQNDHRLLPISPTSTTSSSGSDLSGQSRESNILTKTFRLMNRHSPRQSESKLGRIELSCHLDAYKIREREGFDFATFSPTAKFLAVAIGPDLITLRRDSPSLRDFRGNWSEPIRDIVGLAASDSFVLVGTASGFRVYEFNVHSDPISKQEEAGITAVAISRRQEDSICRIGIGTKTGDIQIWAIEIDDQRNYVLNFQALGGRQPSKSGPRKPAEVSAIAFSRNGTRMCVGSRDRCIEIFRFGAGIWTQSSIVHLEGLGGPLQKIKFTSLAFREADEDQVAFTTNVDDGFPPGGPSFLHMQSRLLTAFPNITPAAQTLAISPSGKQAVFVEGAQKIVLAEISDDGGIAASQVGELEHPGGNTAADAAVKKAVSVWIEAEDGSEQFAVLDRMGTISYLDICGSDAGNASVAELDSDAVPHLQSR